MKYERSIYRVTKVDYSNSLNLSFQRRMELVIYFHDFLILSVYLYIAAIKFLISRKSFYLIYNIVKNCDLSIALYYTLSGDIPSVWLCYNVRSTVRSKRGRKDCSNKQHTGHDRTLSDGYTRQLMMTSS